MVKKIYKLTSKNYVYIGKCGGRICTRYYQHKYYASQRLQGGTGLFYSSFYCFQDGDVTYSTLEENVNDDEAFEREDYWIKYYKDLGCNVVNMNKPNGKDVDKEKKRMAKYYYQNPTKYIDRSKAYYWKNRDKILQKRKDDYHASKNQGELVLQTSLTECLSSTEVDE